MMSRGRPIVSPKVRDQRAKACGDCRSIRSNGISMAQPAAFAAVSTASAKAQKAGKLRSPKPSTTIGTLASGRSHRQPLQRTLGRGGRVAVTPGRGHDDNSFGVLVSQRCEGGEGRQMHALSMALEGAGQGRGKAPSGAALAADKDHGLGQPTPSPFPPDAGGFGGCATRSARLSRTEPALSAQQAQEPAPKAPRHRRCEADKSTRLRWSMDQKPARQASFQCPGRQSRFRPPWSA